MDNYPIRPSALHDAYGIAQVQFFGWQDTYRGIIDNAYLDNMSIATGFKRWMKNIESPLGFIDVMLNEKQEIIGFVAGGKNHAPDFEIEAEIYSLYLLKEYQNKGLGRKLFVHGVSRLRGDGFKSFCVFVLTQNPTAQFYRKFNPDMEVEDTVAVGGKDYDEMGLGWSDIEKFSSF